MSETLRDGVARVRHVRVLSLREMRPNEVVQLDEALRRAGASRCARRDVILAATGAKVSRIAFEPAVVTGVLAALESLGVPVAAGRGPSRGNPTHQRERLEVFVGGTVGELSGLAASTDHDEIGEATGVPPCCRRAFRLRQAGGGDERRLARVSYVGAANCLEAGLFDKGLIGFIPCTPDCAAAADKACQYALWLVARLPALVYELTGPGTYVVDRKSAIRLGALQPETFGPVRFVDQRGRTGFESVANDVEWAHIREFEDGLCVRVVTANGRKLQAKLENGRAYVVRSQHARRRVDQIASRLNALGLSRRRGVYLSGGGERPSPSAVVVASLSDQVVVEADTVGRTVFAELCDNAKVVAASRREDGAIGGGSEWVQGITDCDYVLCDSSESEADERSVDTLRRHVQSIGRIAAVRSRAEPFALFVALPLLPRGTGSLQELMEVWRTELEGLAPDVSGSVRAAVFVESPITEGAVDAVPAGVNLGRMCGWSHSALYLAERWPVSANEALCLRVADGEQGGGRPY